MNICTNCFKEFKGQNKKSKYCSRFCFTEHRRGKKENKNKHDIIHDDYIEIELTNNKYALIDKEDYDKVRSINWRAVKNHGNYYAYGYKNGKWFNMHRIILDANKYELVDHIKHNTLDNRKSNLRLCNIKQSNRNLRGHRNSLSKYKGVSFFKRDGKWRTQIYYGNKNKHIGYYKTEIEAAKAYNEKARELFGEFAYLNDI